MVGAGLAGLACAVAAARAGARAVLYEAAPQAGGRCRSFRDDALDRLVDNGTHLLIGANRAALAFAEAIGGTEALDPADPAFPFLDLASGERWELAAGRLPAGFAETVAALGLPWTAGGETVAARLGPAPHYRRLWKPLCEAVLNTAPEDASARLFGRVLRSALLGGAEGLRPWLFPAGLSAAFAAPALATLAVHGGQFLPRRRLVAVKDRELLFDDGPVRLGPDDRAVLALPPWVAAELLPGLPRLPTRAIVNVHFRMDHGLAGLRMLGLVGGTVQWLFPRGDLLSATVSAADRLAEEPAEAIAARAWLDITRAVGVVGPMPAFRVLKERRATIAHTPDALARRPGPRTKADWLFLAGDWLASSWPCTIESAVASGLAAARLAVGRRDLSFAC